jgi:hypothetical protein
LQLFAEKSDKLGSTKKASAKRKGLVYKKPIVGRYILTDKNNYQYIVFM